MKVKLTTKLDKAIDSLTPISPLQLNKKVLFFLGEGFTPDELGYLHKGNKYIKVNSSSVSITEKSKIWNKGVMINENVELLHIDD